MAYRLKKRRSALSIPREKGRMTMVTFVLSSVKSCEGGHGLSLHLLEKVWPSSSKRVRSMTMAIFFPSLVKSC